MENKIAISSLAASISQATGKTKKTCEEFLKEYFRVVAETLEKGESLKIKGFGTFKVTEVESRASVNVNTGERHEIPSYRKVVFTPAKELASEINAPFADFETVEVEDEMPEEVFELEEAAVPTGDENEVSDSRLKEGSAEENADDEVTSEAYSLEETSTPEEVRLPDETVADNEDTPEEEPEVENEVVTETPEEESESEGEAVTENIEEIPDVSSVATQHVATQNISTQNVETQNVTIHNMGLPNQYGQQEGQATVEKPFVSPAGAEYPQYEKAGNSRFGLGLLIGALGAFVICLIIFMLGCFLDWWPLNFGSQKDRDMQVVAVQDVPVETEEVADTVAEMDESAAAEESEPVPEPAPEPVYDKVSTTRYLTTIAREHYGNYHFWPYIYKENEKILGHPDRITPGTKVVVPDLAKYGVDPKNKEDIEKAKKMGFEIYARFK